MQRPTPSDGGSIVAVVRLANLAGHAARAESAAALRRPRPPRLAFVAAGDFLSSAPGRCALSSTASIALRWRSAEGDAILRSHLVRVESVAGSVEVAHDGRAQAAALASLDEGVDGTTVRFSVTVMDAAGAHCLPGVSHSAWTPNTNQPLALCEHSHRV